MHEFAGSAIRHGFVLTLLCLALTGMVSFGRDACAAAVLDAQEREFLRRHGPVRVGVARVEWPPYEILQEGPRLAGISGAYLDMVRSRIGFELSLTVFPAWTDVVEALKDKRIDVVVSVSDTPARREYMRFTRPYLQTVPAIVTRVDFSGQPALDQMAGRKVVVEAGFAPAERVKREYPNVQIVQAPSTLHALVDVASGAADAYVGNALAASALIDRHQLASLRVHATTAIEGGDIRFGARRDLPQLAALLDKGLATVTDSEARELRARWMPQAPATAVKVGELALSDEERAWLRRHPVIRMAAAAGGMPWQDFDAKGMPLGIAPDYVRLIEKHLGVRVEVTRKAAFREVLDAAQMREVDMLVAVAQSPRRSTFLTFTQPFMELQWAMVSRLDARRDIGEFNNLSEGVVAVVNGHVMHDALIARYPNVKPLPVRNVEAMLDAVAKGQADGGIGPLDAIVPVLLDRHVSRLRVSSVVRDPGTGMRIGVRNDWPEFAGILDKLIASLSAEERAAIHSRWRAMEYVPGLQWRTVLQYVLPAALALIAILGVIAVSNRRLRREVATRRRAELELSVARDAAEAASRAKSTFLATMSHEIRTPMNAVLGMLELLSRSRLDPQQRQTVMTVRESGRGLLALIDDILDFSKIEADKVDIRPEPASLRTVIEATLNVFSGLASRKALLLTSAVDPALAPAHLIDAFRLRQVLNNLVSNAVKFTDSGEVRIDVSAAAVAHGRQAISIRVSDTGIGITEEMRARLFQPFQQGGAAARREGGTGLGLSISYRLAKLMGGELTMSSAPRRGTVAELTLNVPVADAASIGQAKRDEVPAAPLELRAAPTRDQALSDRTLVLVAEDHPTNLKLLLQQLGTLGYACEGARDGQEALERWRGGSYGLLITDINMPLLSGYDLARAIRAEEAARAAQGETCRMPIVACTAIAQEDELAACEGAGIDAVLVKPLELRDLAWQLLRWCPLPSGALPGGTPAMPALPDASQPINPAKFRMMQGQGVAACNELLLEYIDYSERERVNLMRAIADNDRARAQHVAHQFAGAAAVLGAQALQTAAQALTAALQQQRPITVHDVLCASFEHEVQRVIDHARMMIADSPHPEHDDAGYKP